MRLTRRDRCSRELHDLGTGLAVDHGLERRQVDQRIARRALRELIEDLGFDAELWRYHRDHAEVEIARGFIEADTGHLDLVVEAHDGLNDLGNALGGDVEQHDLNHVYERNVLVPAQVEIAGKRRVSIRELDDLLRAIDTELGVVFREQRDEVVEALEDGHAPLYS